MVPTTIEIPTVNVVEKFLNQDSISKICKLAVMLVYNILNNLFG